eukprot:1760592-Lingulodinium_polyedra.AAC.1
MPPVALLPPIRQPPWTPRTTAPALAPRGRRKRQALQLLAPAPSRRAPGGRAWLALEIGQAPCGRVPASAAPHRAV